MTEFKVPSLPLKSETNDKLEEHKSDKTVRTFDAEKPENENSHYVSSCPYKVPSWSGLPNPEIPYKFEVFKSGVVLEEIKNLHKKAVWKFGRLPENDIEMAHPTISRFHAILQYRPASASDKTDEDSEEKSNVPEGWYIYDLGSTHGTFLNKQKIPPRVYIRIKVGHMLKLGGSTRWFFLQGPIEDEEPESEFSVTQLKEKRLKDLEEEAKEAERKTLEAEERERNEGVSWGMSEDADEENDITHNPYASTNNEELFFDDPKKTLRGYFEREGLQLEYKCDEMSVGSFICRVELPLDDPNGRPVVAEVVHKGKKKECVLQCALEACRMLDRHGLLRQANQEPQKRRKPNKDSESEDDDFWDRTGDIERKRQRKANPTSNLTLTFEDLLKQASEIDIQLEKTEKSMIKYQDMKRKSKSHKSREEKEDDDLDDFIKTLNDAPEEMDRTEIRKLHLENQSLKLEKQRLQRLIKIAKPVEMPNLHSLSSNSKNVQKESKKQFPMIGKRNQFSKFKVVKPVTATIPHQKELASDEEEIEDNDYEPEVSKNIAKSNPTRENFNAEVKDPHCKSKNRNISVGESITQTGQNANHSEGSNKNNQRIDDIRTNVTLEDKQSESFSHVPEKQPFDKSKECKSPEKDTKKKKSRHRIRNAKREGIDFNQLEEHEASDKYSKWVPPENQTGDGFTSLNEKYGY